MKISGQKPPVDLLSYLHNAERPEKGNAQVKGGSSEPPPEEKVQLSPKARDIQKAREILKSVPEVREEKVRPLKEKIEAGTYNVNGEEIAEKMLIESLIDVLL